MVLRGRIILGAMFLLVTSSNLGHTFPFFPNFYLVPGALGEFDSVF